MPFLFALAEKPVVIDSLPSDFDARMQQYYARRATTYDEIYRKEERQADLLAIKRALSRSLANRRVLDLACGTGYLTQFFAADAHSVVGVDAAQETLDIATRRGLARTTLHCADVFALDAALGQFDAAFIGFFWSHIPNQRIAAFISALKSHLAPGARVILIDNLYVEGSSTPIAEVDANGNGWQLRTSVDGERERVLKNYPTRDRLMASFGLGATSTHWWRLEYYWWFEYRTQ